VKVSALILTFNEERNIATCLGSLTGIDDIVVVDSGSTDRTCSLAEDHGARILTRPFDNFANQRNFGLDEGGLRNEWVLHLDADEVTTPEFLAALESLSPEPGIEGYRVPSKTILNGRWLRYSGMYPTYQVRIGHRDRMRFRQVGHGQREDLAPEQIGTLLEPYLHYNFSHGITQWLRKHVGYADAEAEQLLHECRQGLRLGDLFAVNRTERRRALKRLVNRLPVVLRPPLRFLHAYVLRRGFLEGRAGLQYAVMLSCYEAMIATQVLDKGSARRADLDG
jgi:glycosyltransferase involved in cell wall biosynthesis